VVRRQQTPNCYGVREIINFRHEPVDMSAPVHTNPQELTMKEVLPRMTDPSQNPGVENTW
jgi:hypothetical protein